MIGMSNDAKERYMRGEYQYARLTMERSPYEPYKGEVFSTQLSVEGQNIFTRENETDGKYLTSTGDEATGSTYAISDYLEVEPSKRYVINGSTLDVARYHAWYDSSKTLICTDIFKQESFVSPSNAKYVRLTYIKATAPTDMHIEVGTVTHGILDVKTGILTVDRGFISDLSNYYFGRQNQAYPNLYRTQGEISGAYLPASSERNKNILSSHYRPAPSTSVNNSMADSSFLIVNSTAYTRGYLTFRNNNYEDDLAGFRESVVGVQVEFPYAEPCTYQLTPQEVTTLLNENNIWSDTGGVRVTYRTTAGTEKSSTKNICPNVFTSQTIINGVTITVNNDGSVHCKGLASADVAFNITDENNYIKLNADTEYTMSGCPANGGSGAWRLRLTTTPTGTTALKDDNGNGNTFTVEQDTSAGMRILVFTGNDVDFTYYPMVEVGSEKTPYEPYYKALVHITDGANNIPVTSLVSGIKYKQDLHGYDYPWVGGGGKNICPNIFSSQTINGVQITVNDDGTIYCKGTASALVAFNITNNDNPVKLKAGNTYALSGCPQGGRYGTYDLRLTNTPAGTTNVATDYGRSATYTPSADMDGGVRVVIFSGQTVDFTYKPMVEVASSPTSYAPYENICPIEGWEEVNVTRTAGNTYNAANLVLSAGSGIEVIDANTIQVAATNGQENRNVYPLIKGTAKTLKFDSAAIRSVGAAETYHIYERVNGVLNSIATVEQTGVTKAVTASVSADADALVIGGWSGLNTICEFRKIRLATGEIPEPLVITNSDIVDGGYSINRYVVTGDSLQFGSCVSGELTLILDNHDGKFNNESFMSKEIHAEVGIMREDNFIERTSLGWFTVDESPKKLSKITLAALDRMMKFEKKVDPSLLSFPITLYELLERICEICGVVLRTGSYNFLNADYNVMEFPSIAQTYRDILSYICEINGSCAYMNINGELVLKWFSSTPAATLDTSNRFDSDIDEHAVIIYGVSVITETENFHAGTVGFDIQVGHNPLITYDEQAIADSLFAKVGGFTYYPFTASTMPMPFFEPMDGATFIDNEGNSHFVAITDVTFRLNRNTALSGKGQTIRETDYERKYGVSATYANVDEALEIIKNTIIKNAEIVTQQMQEIVSSYTGLYEAISSEFGSYRQETDAKITQNAEGLTQAYTNIQQIDSKYGIALTDTNEAIVQLADGAVATNTNFRSVTEAYIKSGLLFYEGLDPVYGVAVGQLTYEVINGEKLIKRKGVYSVFTAEELAFYVDDVKVAYFRNNKLYISNAEFLSAVRIGDYTLSADGNGFTIR